MVAVATEPIIQADRTVEGEMACMGSQAIATGTVPATMVAVDPACQPLSILRREQAMADPQVRRLIMVDAEKEWLMAGMVLPTLLQLMVAMGLRVIILRLRTASGEFLIEADMEMVDTILTAASRIVGHPVGEVGSTLMCTCTLLDSA